MTNYRAEVKFEAFLEAKSEFHAERFIHELIGRLGNVKTEDLGGLCWPDVDWDLYAETSDGDWDYLGFVPSDGDADEAVA